MKTLTHEERLELIYRPFIRVPHTTAYPWGGTDTTNQFDIMEELDHEYQELMAFVRRRREAYENGLPEPAKHDLFLNNSPSVLAAVRASAGDPDVTPQHVANYFDLSLNTVVQIQQAHLAHLRKKKKDNK